jgi:hypothetical protein
MCRGPIIAGLFQTFHSIPNRPGGRKLEFIMRNALLAAFVALITLPSIASAQDRATLGFGRSFTNDALGDGRDRWRTGSYAVSLIRGQAWQGQAPARFGELLEFRARMEIIAPANLTNPDPDDRRYVGALSLGVHNYLTLGSGTEARVGADLVVTGAQTGVGELQTNLHSLFGLQAPGGLDAQIGNEIHPTVSGEMGRSYAFGENSHLRPFVEGQAGVESYVRVGGDLVFGDFGQGSLMLRDQVTGQRYISVKGEDAPGFSFSIGGDVARVFSSAYLPEGGTVEASDTRNRLRAGVHWRGEKSEVFYGITHLSREFKTQSSGQTLGSLRLHLRF